MMIYQVCIFILLYQVAGTTVLSHIQAITKYLHYNNIKLCYFLNCIPKYDKVQISKVFYKENIQIAVRSTEDLTKDLSIPQINTVNLGYVINKSCNDFSTSTKTKMLLELLLKKFLKRHFLFLVDDLRELEYFHNINLGISSKFSLILKDPQYLHSYNFFDIFAMGQSIFCNKIGDWNSTHSLFFKNISYYTQRINMTTINMRTASTSLLNYKGEFNDYILDRRIKREDAINKYHYGLFQLLKEIHNFSYTLIVIKSSKTGNASASTMVKLIKDNKIEISIAGVLQIPSNIDVVDYLMPSYVFKTCFFLRSLEKSTVAFLKPFSRETWIALIVISITITIFLKIAFWINEAEDSSWAFSSFVVMSTICQQGLFSFPSRTVCRFIFLNLLIMSLILYNYYTSSMVSLLLNVESPKYHTIDELINSDFEIAVNDQSFIQNWFYEAKVNDIHHLYKNKILRSKTYIPEEGIIQVGRKTTTYYVDTSTAYEIITKTFSQEAICDLVEIPMIPQFSAGLIVQKNSGLSELFDISLQRLRQTGMIHRLKVIWEPMKPECYSCSEPASLSMKEAFVAFKCLIVGILMATIFLGFEKIWATL